ncbi:pectate lyase [Luteimonas sp. WGS1318]|uniref:pectate lyase n=1 Tax=Luteimonas sp. WGS1318 TaxID=3366815 RepID=UPI00372D75BC
MRPALLSLVWLLSAGAASAAGPARTEPAAERMLAAQTASGGWPKHLAGRAIVYDRPFDATAQAALDAADRVDDATIDNDATTREIRWLAAAWATTGNAAYRDAARRGVDYLLDAQYPNGGWPQFHPDRSGYRAQVTFNDDAIVHVVELLQDIAEAKGPLSALTPERGAQAAEAVGRALALILDVQVVLDGAPTVWAAQYDPDTLQPATARSYELPSLASAESASIVRLLLRQPTPSPRLVAAVDAAEIWFRAHGLADLAFERSGRGATADGHLRTRPGATLWARFYELERQQPLLVDRGGVVVPALDAMSRERRGGYAWYGTWPQRLLDRDLPAWRARHGLPPAPPHAVR